MIYMFSRSREKILSLFLKKSALYINNYVLLQSPVKVLCLLVTVCKDLHAEPHKIGKSQGYAAKFLTPTANYQVSTNDKKEVHCNFRPTEIHILQLR